jgi:hypothetical protein
MPGCLIETIMMNENCEVCHIVQKMIEDNRKKMDSYVPKWVFILLTSFYIAISTHQLSKINDIEKALVKIQVEINNGRGDQQGSR